ncbi:MAG: stage VI sporulation protein F [Clostridia bacterium]|nr:stage VI sporulation protein F [Clostridia bacterium]
MNNDVFSKVESKTKVKKEDIFSLARSIQNKDLKDENELRKIIKDVAKLAGKEVSKEKEEKIIDAIIKDKNS